MSDAATAAPTVPETPAVAAAETPVAPAPEPEITGFGRVAKAEVRRSFSRRQEEPSGASPTDTAAGPTVDALGREHAPDGKYLPGSQEPTPAATQPDPNAPAPEAAATPADATAAPQPTTVRIPLPTDHPLRAQGLEFIEAPAQQEMQYRALVNAAARRADVDRFAAEKSAAEQRAAVAIATANALQEQFFAVLQRPDLAEQAAQIEQAFGPEAKAQYLAGLFAQVQQEIAGKASEAEQQILAEQQAREAEQAGTAFFQWLAPQAEAAFRADGWPVDAQFGAHLQTAMDRAADKWTRMEAAGMRAELNTADIYTELVGVLFEIPTHRDAKARFEADRQAKAEAERDRAAMAKAEAAAKEREAEALKAAGARQKQMNPLARIPSAVRTTVTSTAAPEVEMDGKFGRNAKNAAKQALREELSRRSG